VNNFNQFPGNVGECGKNSIDKDKECWMLENVGVDEME